jgi:kumamolisin
MKFKNYMKHSRIRHRAATAKDYTPTQLRAFYFGFAATGAGKKIGVIELGGAYNQADLDKYFTGIGAPKRTVVFHSIDGGQNTSDGPNGADGEVMLDLCVAGGMAPGAELHCYTSPNTDAGFLAAINQAIDDKMDAISISWGGPEDEWDTSVVALFNAAFSRAASAGITVTAAAGDNGSSDGESGKHVDFPASSPYVLGCGGTSLESMSPVNEVVWNDGTKGGATGGGLSALFTIPPWQAHANVPGTMRGVPDIAAVADPETGIIVEVDGQQMVIGGTSGVAPLMAALSVCLSQGIGKNVGFLNPTLYALAGWQRDILTGNNGTYTARSGYDCCTGLGVPVGAKLLALLMPAAPPAPTPPAPPAPPAPPQPQPPKTHTVVIVGGAVTVDGKTL